jgi:hypothetical protein
MAMAHQVFWHVPQQILGLELEGDLSLDHFDRINEDITNHLNGCGGDQHILLVDITRPATVPRLFARLKASQTYTVRNDVRFILVAGNNKLMRLMMMLTFNLCRPTLIFFDTVELALDFAARKQALQSRMNR